MISTAPLPGGTYCVVRLGLGHEVEVGDRALPLRRGTACERDRRCGRALGSGRLHGVADRAVGAVGADQRERERLREGVLPRGLGDPRPGHERAAGADLDEVRRERSPRSRGRTRAAGRARGRRSGCRGASRRGGRSGRRRRSGRWCGCTGTRACTRAGGGSTSAAVYRGALGRHPGPFGALPGGCRPDPRPLGEERGVPGGQANPSGASGVVGTY